MRRVPRSYLSFSIRPKVSDDEQRLKSARVCFESGSRAPLCPDQAGYCSQQRPPGWPPWRPHPRADPRKPMLCGAEPETLRVHPTIQPRKCASSHSSASGHSRASGHGSHPFRGHARGYTTSTQRTSRLCAQPELSVLHHILRSQQCLGRRSAPNALHIVPKT